MQAARAYPSPPFLVYETIRERADAFLARHGWRGEIPVDIEHIVDVRMGIDIVSDERLDSDLDVDGFLSRDRRTVYVDPYTSDALLHRYRFTLGHEAGHHELHEALYKLATFESIEEWKGFIQALSPKDKSRYEFQANSFAGLVLAPAWTLRSVVREVQRAAWMKGYDLDPRDEADRTYLVPRVANRLRVSGHVVEIRGRYDGLW